MKVSKNTILANYNVKCFRTVIASQCGGSKYYRVILLRMAEVISKGFGKRQLFQKRDMSDPSQHQYNQPPPDIMPKGLKINGIIIAMY